MTRSHLPFRHMKQFKAVAADWEYFTSLSDEGQLYCLTDQQVYILLVQCEYIGWLTRWYNTLDITQKTVQFVQADVMEALMSCVDVKILTDQAALNLVDSVTNKQIESQALRDILEDRYDGTPTSINPNAPTTNFGATGDRYDALCAGLMAFVYQFARAQADSVRAGQVGGLAAVALIALLLIPGLNIFFVVGASIAVLLGLGTIGVTTEVAIQALTDTTALDAVVCCMRENLKSLAVTEANWLTALSGCSFDVGSHEQIVSDFLTACLADNYLTILNILGQAYTGVIDGEQLPECPCEPPVGPTITLETNLAFPSTPVYVFQGQTVEGWDIWDVQFKLAGNGEMLTSPARQGGGCYVIENYENIDGVTIVDDAAVLCAGGIVSFIPFSGPVSVVYVSIRAGLGDVDKYVRLTVHAP